MNAEHHQGTKIVLESLFYLAGINTPQKSWCSSNSGKTLAHVQHLPSTWLKLNAVRGYKGAAGGSTPSSLFAEAMTTRFSTQQVVDLIFFFSDVHKEQ